MTIDRSRREFFLLPTLSFLMWSTSQGPALAIQKDSTQNNHAISNSTDGLELQQNRLPISLPMSLASLNGLKFDASRYLVSEKLDGVRAFWDGHSLYFRSGRKINTPSWFTKDFPDFPIDGELWMGRGKFEKLSAAVRRAQAVESEWKEIQYCLFELPNGLGVFDERLQTLQSLANRSLTPWLRVIEQRRFKDKHQIQLHFQQLVATGAEGIVLHFAEAKFEGKRNENVLKFKPYFDAEATVIKHLPGTGKYRGLMGALLVEDRAGRRFRLGSGFDDDLRRTPPAIGTWLSYRYRDLTSNGMPRFASYLRPYDPD